MRKRKLYKRWYCETCEKVVNPKNLDKHKDCEIHMMIFEFEPD